MRAKFKRVKKHRLHSLGLDCVNTYCARRVRHGFISCESFVKLEFATLHLVCLRTEFDFELQFDITKGAFPGIDVNYTIFIK